MTTIRIEGRVPTIIGAAMRTQKGMEMAGKRKIQQDVMSQKRKDEFLDVLVTYATVFGQRDLRNGFLEAVFQGGVMGCSWIEVVDALVYLMRHNDEFYVDPLNGPLKKIPVNQVEVFPCLVERGIVKMMYQEALWRDNADCPVIVPLGAGFSKDEPRPLVSRSPTHFNMLCLPHRYFMATEYPLEVVSCFMSHFDRMLEHRKKGIDLDSITKRVQIGSDGLPK